MLHARTIAGWKGMVAAGDRRKGRRVQFRFAQGRVAGIALR